jgi:hypothetical protein
MSSLRATVVLLVALALEGCSQITVTAEHDPSANFSALHTYAWRPGPQQGVGAPRFDSALIDRRVRAAVDRVLASKGYRTAAPGTTPDFLVGYHAVVRRKTSARTINRRYGYRVGGLPGGPVSSARDYEQGTLLIDIIDPATMQLLWRGTGAGVVDPTASPEKREQRINDAVERILADFPPKQ